MSVCLPARLTDLTLGGRVGVVAAVDASVTAEAGVGHGGVDGVVLARGALDGVLQPLAADRRQRGDQDCQMTGAGRVRSVAITRGSAGQVGNSRVAFAVDGGCGA